MIANLSFFFLTRGSNHTLLTRYICRCIDRVFAILTRCAQQSERMTHQIQTPCGAPSSDSSATACSHEGDQLRFFLSQKMVRKTISWPRSYLQNARTRSPASLSSFETAFNPERQMPPIRLLPSTSEMEERTRIVILLRPVHCRGGHAYFREQALPGPPISSISLLPYGVLLRTIISLKWCDSTYGNAWQVPYLRYMAATAFPNMHDADACPFEATKQA